MMNCRQDFIITLIPLALSRVQCRCTSSCPIQSDHCTASLSSADNTWMGYQTRLSRYHGGVSAGWGAIPKASGRWKVSRPRTLKHELNNWTWRNSLDKRPYCSYKTSTAVRSAEPETSSMQSKCNAHWPQMLTAFSYIFVYLPSLLINLIIVVGTTCCPSDYLTVFTLFIFWCI